MIGIVRRVARALRQAPGLRRMNWIWRLGRTSYYRYLDTSKNGVPIRLGRSITVGVPAEFSGGNWEAYETPAVNRFISWLRENPHSVILDVGCEIGFYSLLALSVSPASRVIGFDPDRANLKKAERMCHLVTDSRLTLIHGFISDHHISDADMEAATAVTQALLTGEAWRKDDHRGSYMGLDRIEDGSIPTHSLDGLLISRDGLGRVLLKCDVEGAELLVLRGAQRLIDTVSPALLISVHPSFLPNFGHSVDDVRAFLDENGYDSELLGVDHEEHWWCERRGAAICRSS